MQKPVSKLIKRLIIVCAAVVILVIGTHLAGVALMRHYAETILHPALPQGTRTGEIDLNLFTGALRVKDFELENEGQQRIRFGLLELKISPWRLLGGTIHVTKARLSDAFLRVDRRPDGSYDLGLPPFGDGAPESADAEPLDFSLAGAEIAGFDVEYLDGEFKALAQLQSLVVGAYSLRAESQEIPLKWHLALDEREISGEAALTLDKGQLAVAGELKTGRLDLARIQRLAALAPLAEGEVAYQGRFSWQAPQLTLDGALQAPAVSYRVGDRLVKIGGGNFPGFELRLLTAPQLAVELTPREGSLVDRVDWETAQQTATAGKLQVAGRFRYEDNKLVNLDDLQFRAGSFEWQAGSQRSKLSDFTLAGTLHQGIAGELRLPSADLNLSSGPVEFEDTQERLTVALEGLTLEGLKLRPAEPGSVGSRLLEGELRVAASRIGQGDSLLRWSELAVDLGGSVGLSAASVSSDLTLSAVSLENPALANGPLEIEKISTSGLLLGPETRFDSLRIDAIRLPGDLPETGLKVAMLSFSGGSFSAEQGIDLGDILVEGLQTAVIRDEKSQWRHPGSAIKSQESGQGAGAPAGAADGQPPAWRIGSLKVGGDSYFISGDKTNPAAVPMRNQIDTLQFGEVASASPDKDTPFEIAIHPDKYTQFQIKGTVRPVADPMHLDAEGGLGGLALPRLNGYIENDLGHHFLKGQLDTRFNVKIADNQLDMKNFIELHGAEVEALEGKDGPPLGTAIALLEDRDGYVKIDVPVQGQLDDPNFRVLAALNPVIMKAVAGTAALAIQPLGSVLLVGSLVADQALKVTFNPALFEPGSTELDPAAQEYLTELAAKLRDKPKLALRVCGVAVDAERSKDKKGAYLDKPEDLLEMAQQRSQAVRQFMIAAGTGKKQLRSCRPSLDPKPEAKPRVDIRL